jgi:sugar/nucleoside kinase (ribokinase family)
MTGSFYSSTSITGENIADGLARLGPRLTGIMSTISMSDHAGILLKKLLQRVGVC